ncbi:MAG: TlpA disulfide reductase family protein [Bacteroidetes bacterium]|nr:TlpA disulfide reductase family protein [Bacteroidota bacterium]
MKTAASFFILFSIFILLGFTHDKPKVGVNEGDIAPDIRLANMKGDTMSLYSLRGKMVILYFWASWCSPCRKNSPKLVAIYNKYKERNFKHAKELTVFSVSLDYDLSKWKKAVEEDGLEWENHVSDLQSGRAGIKDLYKINGIPKMYLIDGDGTIIAADVDDFQLKQYLKTQAK